MTWQFPLPRTHTGIPMGNGSTGLLIWGELNRLKITLGRADLWDHRGGMQWTERQNFADIRARLEADDEVGLRAIFKTDTEGVSGQPHRPSVLPIGRVDILLPEGSKLEQGILYLRDGMAKVKYVRAGRSYVISLVLSMASQEFILCMPPDEEFQPLSVPAWEYLGEYLSSISFAPPVMLESQPLSGWIQELPADPAIGVGFRKKHGIMYVLNARAANAAELKDQLSAGLDTLENGGTALAEAVKTWWTKFWDKCPDISIPNPVLDELLSLGLYKFASLTNPSGTAATLQGPWIEEYRMPPWSSDYHFNINVQMCYSPALKAGCAEHLMPLFDLVWSWRDQLRANARHFVGIDDGYMLPHAVDDRCVCMGSFWTGTIDHACAAWVGMMMYDYVLYTGDREFMRERAYPFMKGVMRVFEEMMERDGDGGLTLPVSVSPEYRGADMNAWGADASFQLAAIRRLAENLENAAAMLRETPSPSWRDILDKLPSYALDGEPGQEQIALWKGTILEESHRHHSHLAGICPFDSIDIGDPVHAGIVRRSVRRWVEMGMGKWSGWCIPWASALHSRLDNGGMAELLLEILNKVFMNEGRGSLHDSMFSGFTLIGGRELPGESEYLENRLQPDREKIDVMQLDAAMGAVNAIQDMLAHSRRGVIHVFPGIPAAWRNVSFRNMPCEGGFLIDAEIRDSILQPLRITSRRGGTMRLASPWKNVRVNGADAEHSGMVLSLTLKPGGVAVISPE